MGICFSKKKQKPSSNVDSPPHKRNPPPKNPNEKQSKQVKEEETKVEPQSPKKLVVEKLKASTSTSQIGTKEKPEKQELEANTSNVLSTANPVIRTSSCTKEEVDAILLQCGRLSRNSSQKRKHSGSKRSFDFDNDKREDEEECIQIVSRPSPRRRTPSRERSGSKERGSQRRVSRSPNKRRENEKTKQQPMKIVSVPAREKSSTNKRNASPSKCGGRVLNENNSSNQISLSRSNSTKAEHLNFERNPMVEIDENLSKKNVVSNVGRVLKSKEVEEDGRRAAQIQTQCNGIKSSNSHIQLKAAELKNPKPKAKAAELDSSTNPTLTRTRSSRRSSRDLDNIISGTNATANASNYTSFLLEDIQNYHKQNAGFVLPASVSKAHSILEAVADLNSSSSDQSYLKRGLDIEAPFVETEIHVKDDLTEPTIHKYISVSELRKENEPQESAGSNSLVAHSWHSSWEFNSLDSTDRFWNTRCSRGEEDAEESSNVGSREMRGRRGGSSVSSSSSRLMSATKSSSSKKREVDQNRRVGVRKSSSLFPVATASS